MDEECGEHYVEMFPNLKWELVCNGEQNNVKFVGYSLWNIDEWWNIVSLKFIDL